MAQADPSYSTTSQKGDKKISQKQFFDLCTCRQLSVRRLLEAAGASKVRMYVYSCVRTYIHTYIHTYIKHRLHFISVITIFVDIFT